jgi:hypothetical protein|tara:strand:- start:1446 stop:1703 length:258 start_codon:yes stop_codon:yes gene_type:complete
MVEWNYLTTTIAINNFSLYTNSQSGRDIAIYDICDRVNAYVPCNNKEKILKTFKENAIKTKSIQEFKQTATQLLIEINTNWKESL